MQVAVREGVHPWQFGLVVLAATTPLIPLISWSGQGYVILSLALVTAGVVAVPLLLHARPSGFGWSIACVSVLLLPWSFVGAMAGMFLFLPSVLQLWLAAGADPRRRPTEAKVMAGAGLLLSLVVLAYFFSE
ncbi:MULTISPECIES: hypothetical protein [Streptomyces]|uniref:Integral membrane protein n=1 Tax=Streptomyces venezuelae TaxID=54571 RepID=A0A5P2AJL7_STRVZ|nr:hypothetical protein [Streptomyces venezuelae]QES18362.1 hypothetical protein DEJ46_03995 [Streptomyces venezuelae]